MKREGKEIPPQSASSKQISIQQFLQAKPAMETGDVNVPGLPHVNHVTEAGMEEISGNVIQDCIRCFLVFYLRT